MKITQTDINGVMVIEPEVFGDERGYFFEAFNARIFRREVADVTFVQDNESLSCMGTLRGLHFQKGVAAQAKLVRVIEGKVLDVCVDLRRRSPTFGKWISVELSSENHRQLFIPRGLAHGFSVLSGKAIFAYKCDNYYLPKEEGHLNALDPDLGIDWRISQGEMLRSAKDLSAPGFFELKEDCFYD